MSPSEHVSQIPREVLAYQLFRETNDAVVIVDPDSLTILEVNPAVQRMTGYREADLIGKSMRQLLSSATGEIFDSRRSGKAVGFFSRPVGAESPPIPFLSCDPICSCVSGPAETLKRLTANTLRAVLGGVSPVGIYIYLRHTPRRHGDNQEERVYEYVFYVVLLSPSCLRQAGDNVMQPETISKTPERICAQLTADSAGKLR